MGGKKTFLCGLEDFSDLRHKLEEVQSIWVPIPSELNITRDI